MESRQKDRADLYARIAALPSWDTLKRTEQNALVRDVEAAISTMGEEVEELDNRRSMRLHVLRPFYMQAKKMIVGLLDGREVERPADNRITWSFIGGKLHERSERDPLNALISDLTMLIEREGFPFRRCMECSSIFVRTHRQIYCSDSCSKLRKRQSMKSYMREYMREKRQEEREGRAYSKKH